MVSRFSSSTRISLINSPSIPHVEINEESRKNTILMNYAFYIFPSISDRLIITLPQIRCNISRAVYTFWPTIRLESTYYFSTIRFSIYYKQHARSRISALRKITKTYYAYLRQKLTYRMSLKIIGSFPRISLEFNL